MSPFEPNTLNITATEGKKKGKRTQGIEELRHASQQGIMRNLGGTVQKGRHSA